MGEHFFCNRMSVLLLVLMAVAVSAQAVVEIETVPVGNVGNPGEWSGANYGGYGTDDRICGAVDYVYNIGKFEVTVGQYTEFLNAVAASDSVGLYNNSMDGISRSGNYGSYTYSVSVNWANRAVNEIDWGDAVRFANWMHNGQPTGPQDLTTTEDGSYFLNGATSTAGLQAVTRRADATWVIPTEDEWYKAAYHANDGATGNYFDYPTGTDTIPSNVLVDPDPGNTATYDGASPTEVGDHENSASPYGAFDMGGNLVEWNEAILDTSYRGMRGGSYLTPELLLRAGHRGPLNHPIAEGPNSGFRVAVVPEPATLSLLAFGGLAILRGRKNK